MMLARQRQLEHYAAWRAVAAGCADTSQSKCRQKYAPILRLQHSSWSPMTTPLSDVTTNGKVLLLRKVGTNVIVRQHQSQRCGRSATTMQCHHHRSRHVSRRTASSLIRSWDGDDSYPPPSPKTIDLIQALSSQQPTPLSLSDMYKYVAHSDYDPTQRLRNAQFLHRELQIRIAHRITDLSHLPYGLAQTESIRNVINVYISYLHRFQNPHYCPIPQTYTQEDQFSIFLQSLVLNRTHIPMAIYKGLASIKDERREMILCERYLNELDLVLYQFFTARVGLRFLTEHHILSSPNQELVTDYRVAQNYMDYDEDNSNNNNNMTNDGINDPSFVGGDIGNANSNNHDKQCVGAIQRNCNPIAAAKRVAAQVKKQCQVSYGMAPDIQVVDCFSTRRCKARGGGNQGLKKSTSPHFTYVPHHLHYMLAELLKNSCRAVLRQHYYENENLIKPLGSLELSLLRGARYKNTTANNDDSIASSTTVLPTIRVIVVKGEEDVAIKIADRGGGVPRSAVKNIWTFAHSTIYAAGGDEKEVDDHGTMMRDDQSINELKSYAADHGHVRDFGLPLARIYARYFGGNLTIKSLEGYGVDAYLHLPVLGDACENLPARVYKSPGNLDSNLYNFSSNRGIKGKKRASSSSSSYRRDDDRGNSYQDEDIGYAIAAAAQVDDDDESSITGIDSMYTKRNMVLDKLSRRAL